MAVKTPPQVIVNESTDSSLNHIYTSDLQSLSGLDTVGTVYITNKQEYVTNYFNDSKPGGASGEVQLNIGGKIDGDAGLRYDAESDSLTVSGNVFAGNVRTDNLLYANGEAWSLGGGGSNYGNSNVAAYLPTYTGNVGAGNIKTNNLLYANGVAWNFAGTYANSNVAAYLPTYSGAITASSVTAVTFNGAATRAGTVTASAQPNIHSVGSLTSLVVTGSTSLGLVGNIQIDGGTSGQYLSTNGSGGLSWADAPTVATPSLQSVTSAGSSTSNKIHISEETDSTSYSSASALRVNGGLSVGKTIHTGSHVSSETTFFAGHLADFSSWTVPKFIGRDAGSTYIQGALVNTTETGSADWVAYGDQSDDTMGWMDMGFTGSNFSDPLYSITKSNDGYIICQGMPGQGGNLVIATGDLGGATHRDIVFATGGFLLDDERMRLNHEDSTFFIGAHGEVGGTNVTNLDVNGNVTLRSRTTLGAVANVKISGGTSGYVLSTDGTGNLSWSAPQTVVNKLVNGLNEVVLESNGAVTMPTAGDGSGYQLSPTVAQIVATAAAPTVVYTSIGQFVTGIKAVITVMTTGDLVGDTQITDTQISEMLVTIRYTNVNSVVTKTAVGSVYGVTHTSASPLATFTVNVLNDNLQILAEPSNLVVNGMTVQIVATEILGTP